MKLSKCVLKCRKNGVLGEAPAVHPRHDHWWIGETNLAFTIELDGIYKITDVYFYNNTGDHIARVKMGTPFAWEFDKEFTQKKQEWCGFDVNFDTDFTSRISIQPMHRNWD